MKNKKMSTVITTTISFVAAVCMLLLFFIASHNMTLAMKNTAMENMETSLSARAELIEQSVTTAERELSSYGKAPVVTALIAHPEDSGTVQAAQTYTENFYAGLSGWEGVYIASWDAHVLAHSNAAVVGIYTREGDALKQLQDALLTAGDSYNAGIIVSPASGQLVLSLCSPVRSESGEIIGYVGGAQFAAGLLAPLQNLTVGGMEDARNYVINTASGTHIFDEDETLMGAPIENEMLLTVIGKINANPSDISGDIEYVDENGVKSIAMYQFLPERNWAVVLSDSESEIYGKAQASRNAFGVICLAVFILLTLLSWLSARVYVKPLAVVKNSIIRLKNLELEIPEDMKKYVGGRSETGEIATAVASLYETLRGIVSTLRGCIESLNTSTGKMSEAARALIEHVGDNSATSEELAAGITTTNEAIISVSDEIDRISELVSQVEEKVRTGEEKSSQLMEAAQNMRSMAESTLSEADQKIGQNREKVQSAMLSLQALTRINDMTEQILDIASQTNLLSLNASIEAARAGEQGRGFAIVAQEIGVLAENSSSTALQISEMCAGINTDIQNVQDCVDDIISFMEKDVADQFKDFAEIANGYSQSVEAIKHAMGEIGENAARFVTSVSSIKGRMETIQDASDKNETGVGDIVSKIEQTNLTAEDLGHVGKVNQDNAQAIHAIVERFTE